MWSQLLWFPCHSSNGHAGRIQLASPYRPCIITTCTLFCSNQTARVWTTLISLSILSLIIIASFVASSPLYTLYHIYWRSTAKHSIFPVHSSCSPMPVQSYQRYATCMTTPTLRTCAMLMDCIRRRTARSRGFGIRTCPWTAK